MNKISCHILVLILLLSSCSSTKRSIVIQGDINDAIEIAIEDFLKSCKLQKDHDIFSINIYIDNEQIWGFSISGEYENKLYIGPDDKVGQLTTFPNKYIEKKGKLFYWNDPDQILPIEIIDIFCRYDHLDSTYINGFYTIPDYVINERQKGADYYFCKNNLSLFKRVVTYIAMEWYTPPKLKCAKLQ